MLGQERDREREKSGIEKDGETVGERKQDKEKECREKESARERETQREREKSNWG